MTDSSPEMKLWHISTLMLVVVCSLGLAIFTTELVDRSAELLVLGEMIGLAITSFMPVPIIFYLYAQRFTPQEKNQVFGSCILAVFVLGTFLGFAVWNNAIF